MKTHPYFTQSGGDREGNGDQYIANMRDGAVAGFKYFRLGKAAKIRIEIRGKADGAMQAATDPDFSHIVADLPVIDLKGKKTIRARFSAPEGVLPLFFRYQGDGSIDFLAFELEA